MSNQFNAAQCVVIDQDNRNMALPGSLTGPMSGIVNDLYALSQTGTVGVQALGNDIDSLCLGGGAFSIDTVNTMGLTFAWLASRFNNGMVAITVAGGSVTLAASSTNYVELDRNGTVYSNTSGFTNGRTELYQIVTGVIAIATITNKKPLVVVLGPGSVTGAMLSTAAVDRVEQHQLGTISATGEILFTAQQAGTITQVSFVTSTGVTANNSDYWTFALVDLGAGGVGTQQILATTAVNSTQATGGFSITANVVVTLTLSASLTVAAGDVLKFAYTATGAPTAMSNCALRVDQNFPG